MDKKPQPPDELEQASQLEMFRAMEQALEEARRKKQSRVIWSTCIVPKKKDMH